MNFYYLPSKKCIVTWSQKCACTALSRWIKYSFDEGQACQKATSMRTYLAKAGHNFKDINKLKSLTTTEQPKANKIVVAYRDPASRITSSFINKFHVYENRTIFDGKKKIQGFSQEFSTAITQSLNQKYEGTRDEGDFSLREMILFLWECKVNGSLEAINPHFTPQLISKEHLNVIKLCGASTRLFPLKVESLRDDLEYINNALSFNYLPPHMNSTSKPGKNWGFSDSVDLVDLPLSKLYAKKVIPKSNSLRKALEQDQDFNKKYMEVFQHDYELLRWMDELRHTGRNQRSIFVRSSKQGCNA